MAGRTFKHDAQSLGTLLSRTTPPLRVPEYQRDYSWEEEQVAEFWNDLVDFTRRAPTDLANAGSYFLGAVVLVNNGSFHLVLDGQQRLATSTILVAALRDALDPLNKRAAQQVQDDYVFFEDHLTGKHIAKLQLNRFDTAYFRATIQDFPRQEAVPATKPSHRLIRSAYKFFAARLTDGFVERPTPDAQRAWLSRLANALVNHFEVIILTSDDEDDASTIFETLNARGLGLSTGDLLRSWLLSRARSDAELAEMLECWSDLFGCAGTGERGESIIRWSWIAEHGDVKARSLYKEIKKDLVGVDALQYCRTIRNDAQAYRDIRDGDCERLVIAEVWSSLDALKAHAAFPLLFAAKRFLGASDLDELSWAAFALCVRHNVVCRRDRARFETACFEAALAVSNGQGVAAALDLLRGVNPSDEDFRLGFSSLTFARHQAPVARVLLRLIEQSLRATHEDTIADSRSVHVEHIYPRNPPAERRWESHDALVGSLGNLTLLAKPLNESASNAAFEAKRDGVYAQSRIEMTRRLTTVAVWDEAALASRTRDLCEQALSVVPSTLTPGALGT
ncbi:MAG: DUF262 domain-containing HNH endonuclease family protein [Planctomycetes bacterium]|nr:DUF262 domain-containing HNH endonuclease family protein [Planctomycetota bacterium]